MAASVKGNLAKLGIPDSPKKTLSPLGELKTPKNTDPNGGQPVWFLARLANELMTRQPVLIKRGRYSEGYHDLPTGDRRYMRALMEFRDQATTNYYGMIARAPVERMSVTGFRFGPVGTADEDAQSIWAYNDMDLESYKIHYRAAKYGLAYALVSPPDEEPDGSRAPWPTITAEDPRTCIVYRDPVRPSRSLAGLRMWVDDVSGYILAMLYMPDKIYFYQGPEAFDLRGLSVQNISERLGVMSGQGAANWKLLQSWDNEIGEVPLVEYVWRPESGVIPEPEAGEDIRKVQDRINQTIFSRIAISHYQAYKQRWVSGADIPKGKKAKREAPFDPGFDMLWVTGNPETKFGEFSSADISSILEGVRDDVSDIAALSSTPAHYLMGKVQNVSGETLTQVESAFVSKIQQRQNSMGWSHEKVMKLCFAYLKQKDKATDVTAETLWADPQKQILAELALAGQQWSAIGIPLELIMKRQDWLPDDIEYAIEQKKIADEQALEQQNQMMEVQHSQAMEMATVAGKVPPGAGKPAPGAKKAVPGKPGAAPVKPGAKPVVPKGSPKGKAPGGKK